MTQQQSQQPQTKQERVAERLAWKERQAQQQRTPGAVVMQPVTAWQSLPTFVRFAVWVWAIATVACLTLGWLVAVLVWGLR